MLFQQESHLALQLFSLLPHNGLRFQVHCQRNVTFSFDFLTPKCENSGRNPRVPIGVSVSVYFVTQQVSYIKAIDWWMSLCIGTVEKLVFERVKMKFLRYKHVKFYIFFTIDFGIF